MTVKSERGRRRYCAFKTNISLTKRALVSCLPKDRHFKVLQCAEGMAVIRCSPEDVEECAVFVRTADVQAEMVRVSGTVRTLRDRYSILAKTAPPHPVRKSASHATPLKTGKRPCGGPGPSKKP